MAEVAQSLRAPARYGIGLLLVAIAYLTRLALDPWLGNQDPLFTFVFATTIAAIALGIGPMVVVMVLGAVIGEWSFMPPRKGVLLTGPFQFALVAYVTLGIGSAILGQVMRIQRQRMRKQLQRMTELLAREKAAQTALVESQRLLSDAAELSETRAQEARYHEDRARSSEETLALAVEGAALGTWDVNPVTGSMSCSDRSKELIGLPADASPTFEEFLARVAASDRAAVAAAFSHDGLHQSRGQIEVEFETVGTGQPARWIRAKGRALFGEDGQPIRLIGTLIDNTEQKRLTEAMREARDSADSANRAKTAFLANMSHEIRTPLNAIMGFSEMLLDPALSGEERTTCVATISRNGQMLARLIDDILDLSKVEAGKIEVERAPLSLSTVLAEVGAVVADLARKGNVLVEMRTEPNVPETIESDPVRLRQILINLVGNAVKFTHDGRVTLMVKVIEGGDDGKDLVLGFEVRDEGPGIPKEYRRALFRPFQQTDASTTRRFGGTGLGLALSRRLARALGGNVRLVTSELGKGSTFLATIAAGRGAASPRTQSAVEVKPPVRRASPRGLTGMSLLVVEDTPDSQFLIRRILQHAGATVETASDGAEAVRKATEAEFDAVLMDIQMPVLDGYEATATLRQGGYAKPIIALTAHAMKEDQEKALQSGFNDHVTKPVHTASLIETVAKHVHRATPDA